MVAGATTRAPAAADQQPAVGDHSPEVEAAASTVEVPVGAFNDMVVDPATGDVYLSGGEGVVSVSPAGEAVEALELGRAGHLAVEGDDLWVTLVDAGQVARIDLGAFAVAETFEVGDDLREPIVALDDGTVWFQAEGGLWRLEPATGQVGARGGPAGDLTEVPGRSDLLLVSTDDSYELLVHRVDVSGASASITASVPTGDGFGARELAASSDGERFSVAVRRGSQAVIEYGIDTMTATDAPSPVASPGALGVVRRGDVVAAVGSDLGVGMDGGPSTHLFSTFGSLARGVELSPDGRRAYTVSFDYPAYELDTWELQPRIETTTPAAVVADVPAAVGVPGGGLGGVSQATVAGVEVEILDGATTSWVPLWLPRGVDAGEQELQLHTPFGTASATLAVQENVGATLVGQVVVGGAGAEDRQVVITGGDLVSPRATTTAPDGEYRFDGLPQGTYDLSVRHRGADAAEQRLLGVELVANRTRRIDVDLTPPAAEPGAEVARTRLGFQLPRELVHDAASQHTFVADHGGVVALDGSSGRVLARFVGIVNPSALTLGDGALFVLGDEDLSSGPQRIHRIDVDSLDVEASWPVGETARGPIAHAGDRVWFSDRDSHLTALDPATGEVEDHGHLGLLRPAPNSVDGGPDLLVVGDATTASPVDVYGVAGGSPVRLARSPHGSLGSNRELAASVEAGLVWASNGSSFSLEDASPTGSSHPTTRHSVDVTSAHGGMVLGGALVSNGGGGAPTHRIGHQPVERGAELTPDGGAAHLLADIDGPGFDGSAAIWDLAPHIRSIEAPVPDGGGIVVLVGDGLGATSAVELDGASAPATVLDESRVEAVLPASEVGAEHIVTVTTPWGTSAPFVFETGSVPPEPVRHVVATPDVERIV